MRFLSEYDGLARQAIGPAQVAQQQAQLLLHTLRTDPQGLFAELRAERPLFMTPLGLIVSRYRDVVETLEFDTVFSVAPWGEAMQRNNNGPNFVLGMDDIPQYTRDISVLRLAVKREDMDRVRTTVSTICTSLAQEIAQQGGDDLAVNYARIAPTLFVGEYFGIPGPTPPELAEWARRIFRDIFFNLTRDPQVTASAGQAAKELREYIGGLITAMREAKAQGTPLPDTVLGRLVGMQDAFGPEFFDHIPENMSACLVGLIDNTCTAIANAIDQLLARPEVLQGAIAAAHADANDLLLPYVLEALRFNVPAPLLIRRSVQPHTLANGTERAVLVPPKTLVFASTASAMMDETELDNPQEFRLDRPMPHYLHFGWGKHSCLGKYVSYVQVVEAVKALLLLPGLRRAEGEAGKLVADGPFPLHFSITCGT